MTADPTATPIDQQALEDLKRVTDSALAYLSLEELLTELLERVRQILSADTAAILLLDPERQVLLARAARGIEEEVRQGVQIPLGRGFAGRIAAEQRPIAIEDVDHADILNPLLRRRGIRSLLGVPMIVEGGVIGVMHVGTIHPRNFTSADARLLGLVADRAALAVDNARLSEQRAMTEMLQRALLPIELAEVPGLQFSAKYLPAETGLNVGGDWYDVFLLGEQQVALVIGDVVGHGVPAAAVMAEARTAVRAYALDGSEPVQVVEKINRLLPSMGQRRGTTLVFMTLDVSRREVTAVNAGHLPSLMIDPSGRSNLVAEATGPALGIYEGAAFQADRFPFPAGSALVLYTDGLVERRGETIDAGLARLAQAVELATRDPGSTLADNIFARIPPLGTVQDDIALLAVESQGPRRPARRH